MELTKIKIWPGWTATRLIGEGSFGKVYEIVRNNYGIEEHSALKIITIPSSRAELQSLKNDGMDDASATEYYRGLVDEFVQEIALMSKLKGNSNIVSYEDYAVMEHNVSIGWDILIRMELLTDLPTYIRNNQLSVNDVIKLGIDVCNALETCLSQKIIHRDIKPDNIFISSTGEYKLGDFGVARTIEKTVSGLSKKGTYTYMAPEVYKGEDYGLTVDIYSLGIVMYKLLNYNREPFLPAHPQPIKYSDKNNASVRRIGGEAIPAPANADVELSRIILKACAHKASDRYQSPSEMKKDLTALLSKTRQSQPVVLQTDQVVLSKTNSVTAPPVVPEQKTEAGAMTDRIDETLSVMSHPVPANAQQIKVPQTAPVIAQQYDATQSATVNAQQYRAPQTAPVIAQQYDATQSATVNVQQYRAPQSAPVYVRQYDATQSATVNVQQYRAPQSAPVVSRQYNATKPVSVSAQNKTADAAEKKNRMIGNILGWIGFGIAFILMFELAPYTVLQTIGILVTQIFFTIKKDSKIAAIIMMVCSALSFAIPNFIVSIIQLKLCNSKGRNK